MHDSIDRLLRLVVLIVCFLGLFAGAARAGGEKGSKEKIKELLKKRLDVATEAYQMQTERVKKGAEAQTKPLDALVYCKTLAKARLDLCETKEDRIKACQQNLQEIEELAKMAEQFVKAGLGAKADALLLRTYILEAEIALEKAKLRVAGTRI